MTTLTAPAALAQVVEYELDDPGELRAPGGGRPVHPAGPVLALLRWHGHPLGLVRATAAPGDRAGLLGELAAAAREHPEPGPRHPPCTDGPLVSVVLCTRDRTELLPRCLDALLRLTHPSYEIVLVDNAPATDATERLVRARYADRVRYLREPLPGLARARNTGLAAARGEICAFTDDDALVDPGWAGALAECFRADERIGCVTGLVLPAELETDAQAAFERYCGFARGFTARSWSLREHPDDPLFPFAGSHYGTGANMAFRTELLRTTGGFDPATGTGTPTHGGEDFLAFLQVITAGHTLVYHPDALLWHRHRRTTEALAAQIHGFGVGYGAYLTAAVVHRPPLLADLLLRLPRGVRQALRPSPDGGADPALARLHLRGLLHGPTSYLASRRLQHRLERSLERRLERRAQGGELP